MHLGTLIDNRRHHKMFKTASEIMSIALVSLHSFGHFMASSVFYNSAAMENCMGFVFYSKPYSVIGHGFELWGKLWGKTN